MKIDLGGNTLVNGYFGGLFSGAADADVLHPSAIGVTVQGWSSLLDSIVSTGIDASVLSAFPNAVNGPNGLVQLNFDNQLVIPVGVDNNAASVGLNGGVSIWYMVAWNTASYGAPVGSFALLDATTNNNVIVVNQGTPANTLVINNDGSTNINGATTTQVPDSASPQFVLSSSGGTGTNEGDFVYIPDTAHGGVFSFAGVYNADTNLYYGLTPNGAPSSHGMPNLVSLGGFYQGMCIGGASSNTGQFLFGVLDSSTNFLVTVDDYGNTNQLGTLTVNGSLLADTGGGLYSNLGAGSLLVSGGSGAPIVALTDVATGPANTSTPVGWLPFSMSGTLSWIPYYQ